jgi:hypothetical protein
MAVELPAASPSGFACVTIAVLDELSSTLLSLLCQMGLSPAWSKFFDVAKIQNYIAFHK